MARSKKTVNDIIEEYDNGIITDNELVETLGNWDYAEQDSNSSPWAADAQYVEGSWDDVDLALDRGILPDYLHERIYDVQEWKMMHED